MAISKEDIAKLLTSSVAADLLSLYHKNLGLIDTPENVARRIGRSREGIEPDLKELTRQGILNTKQVGNLQVIFMDRDKDKQLQAMLAQLMFGPKRQVQGSEV